MKRRPQQRNENFSTLIGTLLGASLCSTPATLAHAFGPLRPIAQTEKKFPFVEDSLSGAPLKLIAACAFGLEAIVKRELIALGYHDAHVATPGRIQFTGDWDAVCKTNLWLRCADRVLIEVLNYSAPDFDALFDTVKDFDWTPFLPANAAFPVNAKSRLSQLTSVPAIQRSVKKALVESLKKFHATQTLDESGPTYRIEAALLSDTVSLTIDTTGPSLHKRGYRKLSSEAPLKETLAAALIDLSVWKPSRILVDPFCGSGTIPIETAMRGMNIAPGLQRDFASSDWPAISAQLWKTAKQDAADTIDRTVKLQISGTDRDESVLSMARYHAQQAGVEQQIHFQQKSFDELRSKRKYGCIITNPPYGERLDEQNRLIGLYESIPGVMQRLPTWSLFLITNFPRFESLIQKSATRRRKLYNGRIECNYYQFLGPRPPKNFVDEEDPTSEVLTSPTAATIPAAVPPADIENSVERSEAKSEEVLEPEKTEKPAAAPVFGGIVEKDQQQAQLFHNRLAKRAKHLRRWPTKRKITCFRLYEKDIPEIPLVVDRYEDHLHITEYERPHERNLARHAAWLELMKKTAASTLDIPIQRVFLKQRLKNRDRSQYEKLGSIGNRIEVNEGGLKFLVNLSDYVDTGLFLDHRSTRQMVRDEAGSKDVLNLFAYTGSFSVYAAAGGARSTTTVDLSKNYLDWAAANMKLNGFAGSNHQFVPADTLQFLSRAAADPRQRFDLVVVDPPTFSNSKSTDEDWNVQTLYVELLTRVQSVLNPGAVVYFSTNFRRFKFDETQFEDFEIREISKQTVPEDFRNRRIHRCWRMALQRNAI